MGRMKVPFHDLQQRYAEEREEILACIDRVLAQGHVFLSAEVDAFEAAVCAYTGAKHCVTLNSGTDALMTGLWALGVGRGDEVITSPVSFIASAGAIAHIGAVPVFADVRDDQNIDPEQVERRITPRTKAILPVHWGGRIADMDAINDIARRRGIAVVEDAAQAMGGRHKGRHGGTLAACGAVSAHPHKILAALGDGGFLLTDDADMARKVRIYRNHGREERDNAEMFGVNSRMDALQAEVLKFRLSRLDAIIERRRRNVALYRKLLKPGPVYVPPEAADTVHPYMMFLVQADDRDRLHKYLEAQGVHTRIYYGTPLHLHEASKKLGYRPGDFPVAERQCARVLALPHAQHISEEQVTFVADQVNRFYGV